MSCFRKKRVVQDRVQNSRIFCQRERRTIFERKAGASEKKARENGERRFSRLARPQGVWGSRASHSRITLTALPAFRKRLFCSLRAGVFSWRFPWNLNLGNCSSTLVTWKFAWLVESLTFYRYSWFYRSILRDFETQVFRMVRVVCGKWLRYAICSKKPWLFHAWFCFLQTLFLA